MAAGPGHFSHDWLALREPADHAARSLALAEALAIDLRGRRGLRIVDLAAGSGNNLRWLAPRLPAAQRWLLLDHDPALLEIARGSAPPGRLDGAAMEIRTRCLDLRELPGGLFDGADLVTASAFFDLVSRDWIEALAERIASGRAAALVALTVDGRRWFTDAAGRAIANDDDRYLADLFNRHQQRFKGLGEALGPEAARLLPAALERAGMRVRVEASDWRLRGGRRGTFDLASALIEDWTRAAAEMPAADVGRIARWRSSRLAALKEGSVGLAVGHVDVLALPGRHD